MIHPVYINMETLNDKNIETVWLQYINQVHKIIFRNKRRKETNQKWSKEQEKG